MLNAKLLSRNGQKLLSLLVQCALIHNFSS
jgi:hypothetical protein